MLKPKLSAFSLGQLVITIAAVMFGLYGFIGAGGAPAGNAPIAAHVDGACAPLDGGGKDPLKMPTDRPRRPKVDEPRVDIPEQPALYNPDDRGDGVVKGAVKFSDGRAVEGMRITAISTDVNVATPSWDANDIVKTHKAYDRYFRELERNTRTSITDHMGRYSFVDLDRSHTYRVTADHAEIGNAQKTGKAGDTVDFEFEVPVVVEGTLSYEGGKLPARYWVTSNADTGQGWFEYVHSAEFSGDTFRIRAKSGKVQLVISAQGWIQESTPVVDVKPEGASVVVKLVRAAVLSGVVKSKDNSPLQGASVYLSGGDLDGAWGSYFPESDGGLVEDARLIELALEQDMLVKRVSREWGGFYGGNSGYTDADGKYRIENIKPGTYTVAATLGSFSDTREVTLNSGENYADFTIDAGCRVKIIGKSSNAEPVTPSYAWFTDKNGQYIQGVQQPVTTKGELEFIGVPAGDYTMYVQANNFPQVSQAVNVYDGANTFDVLFQEPARLSGKISSPGGIPENLYVRISPLRTDSDDKEEAWRGIENAQYVQVNKDGTYTAANLQPGQYEVSAEFNQNDRLAEQTVTLVAGDNTVDFSVEERCVLIVSVDVAPEIKDSKNIQVTVTRITSKRNSDGEGIYRYGTLDGSNQARFAFLPEGEYWVTVHGADGASSSERFTLAYGQNNVSLSIGPPNCVKITHVQEDSQGDKAGLKVGDLITEYNGVLINDMSELVKEVQATKEGDSVLVVVVRNGYSLSFRLAGGRIGINGENHRR